MPRLRPVVLAAAALALVLVGCSGGSSEEPAAPASASATPTPATQEAGASDDAPTLTAGGTDLATGEAATVLLRRGDDEPGVADVTVTGAGTGRPADLAAFSLEGSAPTASPWYVRVRVSDRGLGPLGGASVPLTAVDTTGETWPVTPLVGSLPACQPGVLPETVASGSATDLCLLYLVPPGTTLQRVVLSTSSLASPITWQLGAAGGTPSAGPTPDSTAPTP